MLVFLLFVASLLVASVLAWLLFVASVLVYLLVAASVLAFLLLVFSLLVASVLVCLFVAAFVLFVASLLVVAALLAVAPFSDELNSQSSPPQQIVLLCNIKRVFKANLIKMFDCWTYLATSSRPLPQRSLVSRSTLGCATSSRRVSSEFLLIASITGVVPRLF